jgi:hypothetical protein
MARSTPAQKPRGSASSTSSWSGTRITAPPSRAPRRHRLAGQRVVEVEQQPVLRPQLAHHAGVGPWPSGVGNCTTSPTLVLGVGVTHLGSRRRFTRCSSSGLRSRRPRRRAARSLVRALGQADQALLDGRRQLPGAQGQRGRLVVKGVDHVGAVGPPGGSAGSGTSRAGQGSRSFGGPLGGRARVIWFPSHRLGDSTGAPVASHGTASAALPSTGHR